VEKEFQPMNDNNTQFNKKIIDKVMTFPMNEILVKYCQEQSLSLDIARDHEREIKRFLALTIINPTTVYGMKGPIDELWHMFILFTQKYMEFCHSIAGYYIHHYPSVPNSNTIDINYYERFLGDYRIVFLEEPPPQYWPRLPKNISIGETSGCSPPPERPYPHAQCGCRGDCSI
jgi:hypothetical protein